MLRNVDVLLQEGNQGAVGVTQRGAQVCTAQVNAAGSPDFYRWS